MNLKTVAGKTVFFALICLFVALFAAAFGQENSLTGVVVVVLALMMLGQDLSVRPGLNLLGLVAFTLLMGVGAFVSVWCGNAFVGAAINFAVVFTLCYMTTQDLRSPMHFPFLLGYAFMLSVPVSPEELPVRVAALVVGSVFIVALNVLLNRKRHERTCHDGLVAVCTEVSECCGDVMAGRAADTEALDAVCLRLRGSMYDRLRRSFFSTPGDRTVLDLVSALQMAGHAVCERERDPEVLRALSRLMDSVRGHESGRTEVSVVAGLADGFLSGCTGADPVLTASVVSLRDGLLSLSEGGSDRRDLRGRVRAVARETAHRDSARFTFAVRMSVVFALLGFVWQYWDLENAKWLLFTTVALVLPYVDGAWRKSAMRLTGTLVGVAAFAAEQQRRIPSERVCDRDRTGGELRRAGQCVLRGQFEDEVSACAHRVDGAGVFVEQRELAALDDASAHDADDGVRPLPSEREQPGVPVVQRIEFADDRGKFHFCFPCAQVRQSF